MGGGAWGGRERERVEGGAQLSVSFDLGTTFSGVVSSFLFCFWWSRWGGFGFWKEGLREGEGLNERES